MTEEVETFPQNDQLVLVTGYSGTGKSTCLRNLPKNGRTLYLNAEAGKRLPFRNDFDQKVIEDPYQIMDAFDYLAENPDDYDVAVLDSLSFAMNMFETQHVLTSADTMKAWSNYAQFFKRLMQQKIPKFRKPIVFTMHLADMLDEKEKVLKTKGSLKGSIFKAEGVEAYFSTVVSTKKVPLKELDKYGSKMLNITDREKELGFKYCFQTQITKDTLGEAIRSPMDMFTREETYIDNDVTYLLKRLAEFYG